MQASEIIQPLAISQPVAVSGIKNTIPENATGSNLASIQEGFPQKTMISPQDGGEPPYGQDFNGLFYLSTDQRVYTQNGGIITFNQDVSNAIGGYPQGAILDYYVSSTQSFSKVVSLIDNNTNNFVTTPSYIDGVNWELLNFGGANIDLSNLSPTGQAILDSKLDQTQITNCILEVPQVVNMQQNGEILTVKAGTTLYDASGTVATLNNDITVTLTFTTKAQCYVLINKSTQGITTASVTDSRLSFTDNEVMFAGVEYYLPLGIVTRNIEGKSTIDQVFNGIGYIKNNNYLLPNVKMLISHGYNSDGTYNNVEYITNEVMISYHTFSANTIMFFRKLSSGTFQTDNISKNLYLGELDYIPDIGSGFQWYYNTQTRLWYSHESGETSWTQMDYINLAINSATSTPPIETFRAVDYSDFAELKENSANKDLSNLTNGLANTICTTAPAIQAYGVSIIGSLTNTNNVLSGFSTSNYAQINTNFVPGSNTWEMNFLVTTGDNVSTEQEICADSTNSLEIELINSHFALEINSGTINQGTYTVLANTTYYVKVQFTGTQYILSYSLNGISYTQDVTVTSSTSYKGNNIIYIGKDINNNNQPWLGTVDLTGCNILVNNLQIWQGLAPTNNVYPTVQTPAVVVDSYINGTSWYRVWSDGWCEQGGVGTSTNNQLVTVTLLKDYNNTEYIPLVTSITPGSANNYNPAVGVNNSSSFSYNSMIGNKNVQIYWRTCGYIS